MSQSGHVIVRNLGISKVTVSINIHEKLKTFKKFYDLQAEDFPNLTHQ